MSLFIHDSRQGVGQEGAVATTQKQRQIGYTQTHTHSLRWHYALIHWRTVTHTRINKLLSADLLLK